jgi:hypothetical protein
MLPFPMFSSQTSPTFSAHQLFPASPTCVRFVTRRNSRNSSALINLLPILWIPPGVGSPRPCITTTHSPRTTAFFSLLFYNRTLHLNPLKSALPQLLIVHNLKSFRINTCEKPRGEGSPLTVFCNSFLKTLRPARPAHAL